jgi:hypothetical protein
MGFFGKKYKYHTCPEKGIAVGIYCEKKRVTGNESFYWSWAIKNPGPEEKSFLIFSDSERKRYFKLQIFTDPKLTPMQETSALLEYERERVDKHITLPLPPLIIKIKPGEKHEFKILQPGLELTPGNYWLRVSFEADSFECTSEFIPMTIKLTGREENPGNI